MKKKIVLVAWEISRSGGVEEVSRQVAEVLRESPRYRVKVWKYPKSNTLARIARIRMALTTDRDAVYFFMHPYLFEQHKAVWSRPSAPPAICWAHGIDVWGYYGKQHASALPLANCVIASSHYTKERILENFPGTRVVVGRMAVHTPPTFSFRAPNQPFEILTVGRLVGGERYKGHELVLRAVAQLKNEGIDVRYNIVGEGDDRRRLEELARQLGIADRTVFHGYLGDAEAAAVYAKSAVFVMPSHVVRREKEIWSGEGFGLVYLEASLHGLPVIACDEGGQRDCVVEGKTGFLVRPEPGIIAERIAYFKNHEEERRRMGEEGRRFVAANFSRAKFRRSVIAAVDGVLARLPSAGDKDMGTR